MTPLVITCILWVLNGICALGPNATRFGKIFNGWVFLLLSLDMINQYNVGV